MTVYLLDGAIIKHNRCRGHIHEGVLYVTTIYNGFTGGEVLACYPLTSISRWEPGE